MPGKKTKLILDTNFWISFLISDRLKYLDDIIFGAGVQLVFSEELIEEFITVSRRAKFVEFLIILLPGIKICLRSGKLERRGLFHFMNWKKYLNKCKYMWHFLSPC
jgi:hypothetical protein